MTRMKPRCEVVRKALERQELENKIVSVCLKCPHSKWANGRFECSVKPGHCHSKRVRQWLEELERLSQD